jgi:hypothetical protein
MKKTLALYRDPRFSPNSVEKDKAILEAVIRRLEGEVLAMQESEFKALGDYDLYLSMGRLPSTFSLLKKAEEEGRKVINSGYAIERCIRGSLDKLMRQNGIAMPPLEGKHGYWLKRADASAQDQTDVVYCPNNDCLQAKQRLFTRQKAIPYIVSAHVPGDVIKFYGVGKSFFRYFYPGDDHDWKFSDEAVNGAPHHYTFPIKDFQKEVFRLSELVGLEVYGGDAIIDSQGRFYLIDFNDWPSFSRCRDEAVLAILKLTEK